MTLTDTQFDGYLQGPLKNSGPILELCGLALNTAVSYMNNYILRVPELADQTISISAQTMEQQKIFYTHKHC